MCEVIPDKSQYVPLSRKIELINNGSQGARFAPKHLGNARANGTRINPLVPQSLRSLGTKRSTRQIYIDNRASSLSMTNLPVSSGIMFDKYMKTRVAVLLIILAYLLGVFSIQPSIIQHLANINWQSQKISNIAACFAALGTISAVLVALWQSHIAIVSADQNRRDYLESKKEDLILYNNVLYSPPEFLKFSIGVQVVNKGAVPVYVQALSCCSDGVDTHLLVPNEVLEEWSIKLPYLLSPGEKIHLAINYQFLLHLSRFIFQFKGDLENSHFVVNSNLESFKINFNTDLTDKTSKLHDFKYEYFQQQVDADAKKTSSLSEEMKSDKWLELYN